MFKSNTNKVILTRWVYCFDFVEGTVELRQLVCPSRLPNQVTKMLVFEVSTDVPFQMKNTSGMLSLRIYLTWEIVNVSVLKFERYLVSRKVP